VFSGVKKGTSGGIASGQIRRKGEGTAQRKKRGSHHTTRASGHKDREKKKSGMREQGNIQNLGKRGTTVTLPRGGTFQEKENRSVEEGEERVGQVLIESSVPLDM